MDGGTRQSVLKELVDMHPTSIDVLPRGRRPMAFSTHLRVSLHFVQTVPVPWCLSGQGHVWCQG